MIRRKIIPRNLHCWIKQWIQMKRKNPQKPSKKKWMRWTPGEEEITFIPGHHIFWLPSTYHAFIAGDLRTPDLPFIFWASIWLPLPPKLENATDAVFEALNKFINKLQEVDKKFCIFPHNLTKYGLINTMPKVINEPDDLPTEVEEWLEYFLQANQGIQEETFTCPHYLDAAYPSQRLWRR